MINLLTPSKEQTIKSILKNLERIFERAKLHLAFEDCGREEGKPHALPSARFLCKQKTENESGNWHLLGVANNWKYPKSPDRKGKQVVSIVASTGDAQECNLCPKLKLRTWLLGQVRFYSGDWYWLYITYQFFFLIFILKLIESIQMMG